MRLYGLALLFLVPGIALGLDVGDLDLQIHGTVAQGGLLSSHNNYLTAKTSDGSTQWTEAALNAATSVSDNLRIGLQLHTYRLGELGKLKLDVDWAYGDYRIREWFGIRAGKVKTPLGLCNDTQDIDTLHLWALLPQGVYPADNRSWTLAHTGGDVYSKVRLPGRLGKLSYQGYFGSRTADSDGGYFKAAAEAGFSVADGAFGRLYGGDVRWHTPLRGLTTGSSVGMADASGHLSIVNEPFPLTLKSTSDTNTAMYAEFEQGKFYAAGEYRRRIWNLAIPEMRLQAVAQDTRAWYLMAAYRIHPKVNLGAYCSRYRYAALKAFGNPSEPARLYSNDWVTAIRIDPNPYLYFKFEAHYIDGTAGGFYVSTNPTGFDRLTRLVVARIGFTF
ncbi:MAG: OprO/OprP family phosphate-selective porin [Acidobacteriia bacterium]|nr:OprO/OprP family phosphate-selective porin [Terriglobia bacterium]